MAKLARLSAEDRENLAAYLDGELSDEETLRIESILTGSEVARNDVDVLARTYDMLDLLPRPKVSTDFTERTVATAKLDSVRVPLTQQPWFPKAKRFAILSLWLVTFFMAGGLGYAFSNHWLKKDDDPLLNQYQMMMNVDSYLSSGDIEFLHVLSQEKSTLNEIQRGNE